MSRDIKFHLLHLYTYQLCDLECYKRSSQLFTAFHFVARTKFVTFLSTHFILSIHSVAIIVVNPLAIIEDIGILQFHNQVIGTLDFDITFTKVNTFVTTNIQVLMYVEFVEHL